MTGPLAFEPDGGPPRAAIELSHLAKRYGQTVALDGVSLSVLEGEVFGILGPNGAGKTTTVEILEGYRTPDSGSARVLGMDPIRDGRRLRERIGVMLQEGGLVPGLRPDETLRMFASYYHDPEDCDALLSLVGLDDARRTFVRRLSGGQAQRLSLACALIGRPDVLFLDEPTAGMDPHARATTWELIRTQRAAGRTVVLTTHLMDEAEALCDRIAILTAGRVAALGTPAELTRRAETEDVWFSADAGLDVDGLAAALGLDPGMIVEEHPGEYVVRALGTPERIASLAIWMRDRSLTLGALQAGRRSLEEVFLRITAESTG